ncbi:hypothetical protein CLOM_g7739 [Closterium sp. NIES-68]|nr:hypothetical protein CLOM_g7739 [Closterium sp. NIES-68]GJP63006.1 hypothetical protein CLOP_g20059 [Closterium sp. NIES-67]
MASRTSSGDSRVDAQDGPAAMPGGSATSALTAQSRIAVASPSHENADGCSPQLSARAAAFPAASSCTAPTTTTTSGRNGSSVSSGGGGGGGGGGSAHARAGGQAPWVRANIEEVASRAAVEKAEAERRLAAAEAQLRAALEELYNRHRKRSDAYSAVFGARHPLCQHGDSCVANAVGSLCQSFLLAYGVRVGIGVLLRAFKLIRNKSFKSALDLQLLLSEKNLMVREEACRLGLFFGGFSGLYHAARCLLRRCRDCDTPANAAIAGAVSGLSVLALDDPNKRRSLALYLLARLAQCVCASKGRWAQVLQSHPLRKLGGTALFLFASAQIMYAYVMRPETLPSTYWDFISRTGPTPPPVLEAVRRSCRGLPMDTTALTAFLHGRTGQLAPLCMGPVPAVVPCAVLHPGCASCPRAQLRAARDAFRKTFPLYLSLTFVPFVVLNMHKFLQSPLRTVWLATVSALRSTSFIAVFVGIYQACVCTQRKLVLKDHKFYYWLAGAVAGLSVLIEKASRRTELTLYVLPRALDSLIYILVHRHILPDMKMAEVVLFSACMGGLMYFHDTDPSAMAPFIRGILNRFLHHSSPPSPADPAPAPLPPPSTLPTASPSHPPALEPTSSPPAPLSSSLSPTLSRLRIARTSPRAAQAGSRAAAATAAGSAVVGGGEVNGQGGDSPLSPAAMSPTVTAKKLEAAFQGL